MKQIRSQPVRPNHVKGQQFRGSIRFQTLLGLRNRGISRAFAQAHRFRVRAPCSSFIRPPWRLQARGGLASLLQRLLSKVLRQSPPLSPCDSGQTTGQTTHRSDYRMELFLVPFLAMHRYIIPPMNCQPFDPVALFPGATEKNWSCCVVENVIH